MVSGQKVRLDRREGVVRPDCPARTRTGASTDGYIIHRRKDSDILKKEEMTDEGFYSVQVALDRKKEQEANEVHQNSTESPWPRICRNQWGQDRVFTVRCDSGGHFSCQHLWPCTNRLGNDGRW